MSNLYYNSDIVWMDSAEIIIVNPIVSMSTSIDSRECSHNHHHDDSPNDDDDDDDDDAAAAVVTPYDINRSLRTSTADQELQPQPCVNTIILKLFLPTSDQQHLHNNSYNIPFCCIPLQVMTSSSLSLSLLTTTTTATTKTTTIPIIGGGTESCSQTPQHIPVVVRVHPLLYEFMILCRTEMNHICLNMEEALGPAVGATTVVEPTTKTVTNSDPEDSTAPLNSTIVTIAPIPGYPVIDTINNDPNNYHHHNNASVWYIEGLELTPTTTATATDNRSPLTISYEDPTISLLPHDSTITIQIIYQYDTQQLECINPYQHHYNDNENTNTVLRLSLRGRIIAVGAILLVPVISDYISKNNSGNNCIYYIYYLIRIQEIAIYNITTLSNTTTIYRIDDTEPSTNLNGPMINIIDPDVHKVDLNQSYHPKHGVSESTNDDDVMLQKTNHQCPGYETLQVELLQLIQLSFRNSEIFVPKPITNRICSTTTHDMAAPSGILLTGCAGVGKTRLLSTILSMSNGSSSSPSWNHHFVSVHHLILLASWADEVTIMDAIYPPYRNCQLLVLDDLHLLRYSSSNSTTTNIREHRLVLNSLIQVMDRINNVSWSQRNISSSSLVRCVIIGLGRDKSLIPSELLKVGRLEKEIQMLPPSQTQREVILYHLLLGLKDHAADDMPSEYELWCQRWAELLATATSGCVASDLRRLCSDAWYNRFARSVMETNDERKIQDPQQPPWPVHWLDLSEAAQNVVPSQLAMLDVTKPKHCFDNCSIDDWSRIHELSWETFAGYESVKKRIYRSVVVPWRRQLHHRNDSIDTGTIIPPSGILFHGPSGCGKTIAANCLGSSLGLPMIKVRAADVMDKWLGGSEATLRSLFTRARSAAPCILFFDEIDAIASNRASSDGVTADVMSRLLSTLLNEMDGISSSHQSNVVVVACTNRLESLDAALLRPGRLEEHIALTLPSQFDSLAIL